MTKKLLAILLSLCLLVGLLPATALAAAPTATNPGYGDISGHWAEESIKKWSEYGIFQGDGTNFDPNGEMTRAQAAVIFARLLGLTEAGDISSYQDVDPDAWYADAIAKCVAAGIMMGTGSGMDPNGKVTREQLFVMFGRALGVTPSESCDKEFADKDNVSSWAQGYINALVNMGAIDGMGDGSMSPEQNINRASMVALLDKTVIYVNEPGTTVEADGAAIIIVAANDVTITGSVDTVFVASGEASVTLDNTTVNNVTMSGEGGTLNTVGDTTVGNVNAKGDNVTIGGEGKVDNVTVSGDNASVNTTGTKVDVDENAAGTTVGGESVEPGSTVETPATEPDPDPTPSTPSTPSNPPIIVPSHDHTFSDEWSKDETYHWHAATCEHTGATKDKAEHTWNAGVETTPASETSKGVKTYTCTVCGQTRTEDIDKLPHSHVWTFAAGHAATCKNTGEKDHYTCTCNAISLKSGDIYTVVADTDLVIAVDADNHEQEIGNTYASDDTQHWFTYPCCDAEGTKANHSYDADTHKCVCGKVDPNCVAKIGDVYYQTLAAAVAAAKDGDTVTLVKDTTGAGLFLTTANSKNVTIDFGNHTYTVSSLVGSNGTENQAAHFEKNNTVTLKNGTLTVADSAASSAKMLIQNYCNLTVTNMTLDGSNLKLSGQTKYTLSNNDGVVKFTNCTVKAANEAGAVAVDAAIWGSYNGAEVTLENCTVYGKLDVAKYEVQNGSWTKTADLATVNGLPTIKVIGGSYTDLASAVLAAQSGTTITMLSDVTLSSDLRIGKNLTINGNDKKVISCYAVQCDTNVVVFQNVKFENPTNAAANASHVYGSGSLTFRGCEFVNTQWDSIQYTPKANNSALVVENCVFTAAAIEGSTTQPKRFIHVEPAKNNSFTLAITITGCTFNGDSNLKDDSIGLYYIAPGSTLTLGSNSFGNSTPDVWICRPGNASDKPYENAAGMLTGEIQTYTVPSAS